MNLDNLLETIDRETAEYFEEQLRQKLKEQDRLWLEEQLLALILEKKYGEGHAGVSISRKKKSQEELEARKERIDRIKALRLDLETSEQKTEDYKILTREELIARKILIDPPHKGLGIITPEQRSARGNELLQETRDILYALLFCNRRQNVKIIRAHRDFLTVTLAADKAPCLENFLLAVTEIPARGIWHDPEGVSDDEGVNNTVMQVEFGDDQNGKVSDMIMSALQLLNNLEINEEILYCRIENAQKSSLV